MGGVYELWITLSENGKMIIVFTLCNITIIFSVIIVLLFLVIIALLAYQLLRKDTYVEEFMVGVFKIKFGKNKLCESHESQDTQIKNQGNKGNKELKSDKAKKKNKK